MPDPTRQRPARRTNTRALVGVLLATLLANGVTLGLLLTGQAMPDETTPVPGQALAQTPPAAVPQDASSGAGATHDMRPVEQVPPASEIPAAQADLPGGLQADDTPIPPTAEPINQAAAPAAEPAAEPERMTEPARHDPLPPLEFFGIPLFD